MWHLASRKRVHERSRVLRWQARVRIPGEYGGKLCPPAPLTRLPTATATSAGLVTTRWSKQVTAGQGRSSVWYAALRLGAPGKSRTCDLSLRMRLLYPPPRFRHPLRPTKGQGVSMCIGGRCAPSPEGHLMATAHIAVESMTPDSPPGGRRPEAVRGV